MDCRVFARIAEPSACLAEFSDLSIDSDVKRNECKNQDQQKENDCNENIYNVVAVA